MSALEDRVLNAAADIIEARGWRQGLPTFGWRETQPVCAGEAIDLALEEEELSTAVIVREQVASLLVKRIEISPCHGEMGAIVNWNDSPGRTRSEVLAALRGAA